MGILMECQRKISLKKNKRMIGERVEVLVEARDEKKRILRGRLRTQAPEIDGCVFLKGEAKPGNRVMVRITQACPYDLKGRIERHLRA